MKVCCVTLALMALLGCDSRPTIIGLFGEKIGEKILSEQCEKTPSSSQSETSDALSAMVRVKKPKVAFPISESKDVTVFYNALTNSVGAIEYLYFSSYVSKHGSIKKWLKAVDGIRCDAREKYGKPDYAGSYEGSGYESTNETWYIKGRLFGITLARMDNDSSYCVLVEASTYEQAAKMMAASYDKDANGCCRKKWDAIKDRLPSDFVKLVEGKIKVRKSDKESPSYL